jgi:hypothetical protein
MKAGKQEVIILQSTEACVHLGVGNCCNPVLICLRSIKVGKYA